MPDLLRPDALPIALALAIITERTVEYFASPIWEHFKLNRAWLMYVAAIAGITLSVLAQVNMFGEYLPGPVGIALTGILVGGGSNLIHDVTQTQK
jgi:hypothetical protein